jgi:hypothetical protein
MEGRAFFLSPIPSIQCSGRPFARFNPDRSKGNVPVSEEVADEIRKRCDLQGEDAPAHLEGFLSRHENRDRQQLTLCPVPCKRAGLSSGERRAEAFHRHECRHLGLATPTERRGPPRCRARPNQALRIGAVPLPHRHLFLSLPGELIADRRARREFLRCPIHRRHRTCVPREVLRHVPVFYLLEPRAVRIG